MTIKGQPPLTGDLDRSRGAPGFYLGGEYCPFCAAERWPTIIALSRFGTWSELGNTASSTHTGEIYQGTPTFTFLKAHYSSTVPVLLLGVEAYTNQSSNSAGFYTPLQTPTKAQDARSSRSTTRPSTSRASRPSRTESIPFITIDNQYLSPAPASRRLRSRASRAPRSPPV